MTPTPVYRRLLEAIGRTDRFVSSRGGTRSGKTYAALEAVYKLACCDAKPTITSVVSETFPHLKRGAIRDFQNVLGDYWDEACWSRGESIYTLPNGSVIEFFSADAPAKVHGPARDRLFLNEVQSIPWEIARQLFVRTRGLVLMDYNPVASFWVNEKIETRDNCVTIESTYLDNPFLTPEQVAEIEANRSDANWWTVYGEGRFGTLEGVIYAFEQVDELPDTGGLREVWGMDFGFTHDPTAIVRILADTGQRIAYIDEIAYQTGMMNAQIAQALRDAGARPGVHIWADAAEPKSIAEIGQASGLNVQACDKGAPVRSAKRQFQIQWLQGWKLRPTKRSLNWIREARNYTWAKDRDGNFTGFPIEAWDHCFAAGTMIETPDGEKAIETLRPGDYVITSNGPECVDILHNNGCKKIRSITLFFRNFAVQLQVTPDHKVKTAKGWKEIQNLQPGDVLYLSRNLMAGFTNSTPASVISHAAVTGCTATSGSSTTDQSRPGMMSTIRTAIRRTTTSPTSSASPLRNMNANTMTTRWLADFLRKVRQICTKLWRQQENGTAATPDATGTPNTPASRQRPASGATPCASAAASPSAIVQSRRPASAPTPANQNGAGMPEPITSCGSAPSAAPSSLPTDIATPSPVVALALLNIAGSDAGTAEVFDLTVHNSHEYIANGVLVHNCMDATRYALFSEFADRQQAGQYAVSRLR